MNLSTSPFRPWLIAFMLVFIFEAFYFSFLKPDRITWNSFLDLNFAEDETVQRLMADLKIENLTKYSADIIQVGDSSGLHGVMPKVVMAENPGYDYVNLGVATNVGYKGYLDIAEIALQRNPAARYLVLYTSFIGAVPRPLLWDSNVLMAKRIESEFLNPLRNLIQFPTLHGRSEVIGYTYYFGNKMKSREIRYTSNRGFLAFESIYQSSLGWARETDNEGDVPNDAFSFLRSPKTPEKQDDPPAVRALREAPKVTDEKYFNWLTLSENSYFDLVYGEFAKFAKRNNLKLILIFNPMPQGIKHPIFKDLMDWESIEKALQRLKIKHPEVIITDFEFWPDEKFSVFSHVGTPYALESSIRVARILNQLLPKTPPSENVKVSNQYLGKELLSVDFTKPHAGYGLLTEAGNTSSFPMANMAGNKINIFANVNNRNSPLDMNLEILETSPKEFEKVQLDAIINGENIQEGILDSANKTIRWHIPADIRKKYLGWLVVEIKRDYKTSNLNLKKITFSESTEKKH
jgi:hypothetical protein